MYQIVPGKEDEVLATDHRLSCLYEHPEYEGQGINPLTTESLCTPGVLLNVVRRWLDDIEEAEGYCTALGLRVAQHRLACYETRLSEALGVSAMYGCHAGPYLPPRPERCSHHDERSE